MAYLDAIKVFLTFCVVTFHLCCQFASTPWGGPVWVVCPDFTLSDPATFAKCFDAGLNPIAPHYSVSLIMSSFIDINQAYFMSLFFFISGIFVPMEHNGVGFGWCACLCGGAVGRGFSVARRHANSTCIHVTCM